MSTIEDVRAAEEKVQIILEALTRESASDSDNLRQQLRAATDDYAKAVRELLKK